jgi:hypothetical protein
MLLHQTLTFPSTIHNRDSSMAGSATQSKRKRRKLSRKKDSVLDRISNLPESLLCHILSFLPTKNTVATSILSSRWKLLWTLVPKLDLDTDTIDPYKGNWKLHWTVVPGLDLESQAIFFEHIVFRVLELQQQTQCLQKFRLPIAFTLAGH